MIEFKFSLSLIDDEISAFELGDIDLICNSCLITSRNKNPSQSMMLFISLSELLDLFRDFIVFSKSNQMKFIAADSSFTITFIKEGEELIVSGTDCSAKVSTKEFTKKLYASINKFYSEYSFVLEKKEKYLDLKNSLLAFNQSGLFR